MMKNYSEILFFLLNNILVNFDEVYHSAEIIINDKGIKMPAIPIGDEWKDLSPTDQREIIYLRRNGDDVNTASLGIGSCRKSYLMATPVRLVYFKDHCKNARKALNDLIQSVLVGGTNLRSISQNKWKLLKEESSGDYTFGGTTAYFAIDFNLMWNLIPDACSEDFCNDIDNPLIKQSCPVVA